MTGKLHWGQAMANLSDLLAAVPDQVSPGWVTMLGTTSGVVDRPLAITRPDAGTSQQADLAALHSEALDAAYRRGMADGRAAAATDQASDDQARTGLSLAFTRLDEAARIALSDRLVHAVAALCEDVIAPAMIDRAALSQRCETLAHALGDAAGRCTLHLHADDLALLDDTLAAGWSIQPDPAVQRGTLLLEHADGMIADGPDQWRRLIAAGLGL